MRKIFLAALAVAVVGCAEKLEPMAEPPDEEQTASQSISGDGGIGIISPAVGTSAPVTNAGSVAGAGGGGVQQAAKQQAKDAAANSNSDLLDELGGY